MDIINVIRCLLAFVVQSTLNAKEHGREVSLCGTEMTEEKGALQSDRVETLRSAAVTNARIWPLSNASLPLAAVVCSLQLHTCGLCQLRIQYKSPALYLLHHHSFLLMKDHCQKEASFCFDLTFVEDRADASRGKAENLYRKVSIWDNPARNEYNSTAYKVKVQMTMWGIGNHTPLYGYLNTLFPLSVSVFENTEVIRGMPTESGLIGNKSSTGYIESPRFPFAYPRGVHKNYTLINMKEDGRVRLIFEDHQLHFQSQLKILDSNGVELVNSRKYLNVATRRPAAVQSSGPSLTVLFSGNEYTHHIGFRAKYHFVSTSYWPQKPDKHSCDGVLENFGDTVTISGKNLPVNAYVDCVWVIGKFPYPSQAFDHLYLKVENFDVQTNGAGIRLEIRNGRTSISERIMLAYAPQTAERLARHQPQEGFIADLKQDRTGDAIEKGFYVRLRGYLGSYSGLSISYAQFYRWATGMCPGSDEFHCDNTRCIKHQLSCDSHDHCGDFSDENTRLCPSRPRTGGILHSDDQKQRPIVASFVNLLALIAAVILIVLLMLMVTVVFARLYRQRLIRRFRSEMADIAHRQTGSRPSPGSRNANLDEEVVERVGERRFYVMPETEVSIFEAPPTYDDALKHTALPPSTSSQCRNSEQQLRPTSVLSMPILRNVFDNPSFFSDNEYPGPSNRQSVITGTEQDEIVPGSASSLSSTSSTTISVSSLSIASATDCQEEESVIEEEYVERASSDNECDRVKRQMKMRRIGRSGKRLLRWARDKVGGHHVAAVGHDQGTVSADPKNTTLASHQIRLAVDESADQAKQSSDSGEQGQQQSAARHVESWV